MGNKPSELKIYVNEKYKIPPGWSQVPDARHTFVRDVEPYRLTAYMGEYHDAWYWKVEHDGTKIGHGSSSSRLSSMRKAEFHVHMIRKGTPGD